MKRSHRPAKLERFRNQLVKPAGFLSASRTPSSHPLHARTVEIANSPSFYFLKANGRWMNLHQNPPIYTARLASASSGYASLCPVVKPEKTSTSTPNQIRTIKIPINKIWTLSLVADCQIHYRSAA